MKILVTGGLGFIGGVLAEKLKIRGHSVRIFDSISPDHRSDASTHFDFAMGSVSNPDDLAAGFDGADLCVHLAGSPVIANPRSCGATRREPFIAAARTLFQAAENAGAPVIYASSAAVYGNGQAATLDETSMTSPVSAHGEEKLALETVARQFAEWSGLPSLGLRMFNVYGPTQRVSSPYCGVLRLFAQKAIDGEAVTVYGDGSHRRDFIHVEDAVRFMVDRIGHQLVGADTVNVCTGRGTSIVDAVGLLKSVSGLDIQIESLPAISGEVVDSVGDPAKADARYGFRAEIPLEAGVRAMIECLRSPMSERIKPKNQRKISHPTG